MLKTKFFVRQKSGEVITPIYVRVSNGRAFDLKVATKETCIASRWDDENGMMKERFFVEQKGKLVEKRDVATRALFIESREVNERLQDLAKKIDKAFKEAEEVEFNTEWLKRVINPPVVVENTVPDDFVSFCPVFIEQKKHEISKGYTIKVNCLKRIISEFLKHSKKKSLKFSEINMKFKLEFDKYCYDVMGYSANYTSTNLRLLRIIAYQAERNGIKLHPQIKLVKSKEEKTIFQILTPAELEVIEKHSFEDADLSNIRDWLIISAYSGQRISDFMRFNVEMLTKEELENEQEGYFLNFIQDKTGHILHLPVHPKILKILNKRGFQFPPKYDEDKYNKLVKTVCKDAGITEMCYGALKKIDEKSLLTIPNMSLLQAILEEEVLQVIIMVKYRRLY